MWNTATYPNSVIDSAVGPFFSSDSGFPSSQSCDDYEQPSFDGFRSPDLINRTENLWDLPSRRFTGVPLSYPRCLSPFFCRECPECLSLDLIKWLVHTGMRHIRTTPDLLIRRGILYSRLDAALPPRSAPTMRATAISARWT